MTINHYRYSVGGSLVIVASVAMWLGVRAIQPTEEAKNVSADQSGAIFTNQVAGDMPYRPSVMPDAAAICEKFYEGFKPVGDPEGWDHDLNGWHRLLTTLLDKASDADRIYLQLCLDYVHSNMETKQAALGSSSSILQMSDRVSCSELHPSWLRFLYSVNYCHVWPDIVDGSPADTVARMRVLECEERLLAEPDPVLPDRSKDAAFRAVYFASMCQIGSKFPLRGEVMLRRADWQWDFGTVATDVPPAERRAWRERSVATYEQIMKEYPGTFLAAIAGGSEAMEVRRKLKKMGKSIDDPTLKFNEDQIEEVLGVDEHR